MIKALKDIVGAKNVLDDAETLALYASDQSLSSPKKPAVVVRPKDTAEVQEVITFANKTLTPVVPSSSGIHFWGATLPEQGGIILDLSRMNKILEIDPQNRKVKIQPGVTWPQLMEALKEHGQIPLNPLFPHPKTSALTSSLEREPMLIPKYEYGDPVLTMEVVLPTGDIFKTGTASAANTQEGYPEGPGIDFYRFFLGAQGTMGIVTWLNIKTEYRPKQQKAYFVAFNELQDAVEPIYQIQRKLLGNECFVLSSHLLALLLAEGEEKQYVKLMAELPPYTLVLVIAGAPRRPQERIAYEEEALMEVAARLNFEPKKTVAGIAGLEATILEKLRNLPADGSYWKNSFTSSTQDIFFITTMDRAADFADIALTHAACYGFNINQVGIYLQPLERGRACHLCFSLPCDLGSEAERQNIKSLYLELSEQLMTEGAFFTRPYGPWADMVYRRTTTYTNTLKELKKIFDPNHILNPGKLCH